MADTDTPSNPCVELRKYANRRYYDATQSRHVTLDEIYRMIRAGADIRVTDSKTGDDITTKVLAQIILDHDSRKLGMFPVDLLHQVIRSNETLIRDFVDKYFNHALRAFLASRRQFDRYLRQVLGLTMPLPAGAEWARMMMGPFAGTFFAANGDSETANGATANGETANGKQDSESAASDATNGHDESAAEGDDDDLQEEVLELRRQIRRLENELKRRKRNRPEDED